MSDNAGVIAEMQRKIFALENKVRELDARLPIRVAPAPVPPPAVEPQTIVWHPQPRNAALPDAAERKALCQIVLSRWPQLGPGDDLENQWRFESEVEAAFGALGAFGRSDALSERYAVSWFDDVVEYLRAAGLPGTSYYAFLVSLHAWFVGHNFDPIAQRNGISLAFCLASPGMGRPANAETGWRRVLATGRILEPMRPAVTRVAPSELAPKVVFRGGDASMFGPAG